MPFHLVRLFRRRKHRAASNSATSNISELKETSNSNSNDVQAGGLVQSLSGTYIGTIHGSLFSNNQVHHHHHHHPQADDDADYAEIKVRDIILETELGSSDTHYDLQSDGTLIEVGRIRKYTGRLFQQPHGSMLIHKYEGLAIRNWKRDFHRLAGVRHPNIIQLYGLCHSSNFTALIFHDGQQIEFEEHHLSLSGSSFVTCIADLMDQLQSAADALQGHGLQPHSGYLPIYDIDSAGHLVVDTFRTAQRSFTPSLSFLPSTFDLKTFASTFKHQPLTRSSLVKYYDLLEVACSIYDERSRSFNGVSITHRGMTTELCPPLLYTSVSRWGSQEIPIELKSVSDMLRCTIPISQLQDMSVFDQTMLIEVPTQESSSHSSSPLFHVLASQIHHIIKTMKMNASEVLTVMPYYIVFYCGAIKPSVPLPYDLLYLWHDLKHPDRKNHWWSTDPEGQIPISTTIVEGASDISFDIYTWSYPILQQIYPVLWDIHKACGFDPDSTEIAEYLGYPLLEPRVPSGSSSSDEGTKSSEQADYEASDSESDDGSTSSQTFFSACSDILSVNR